jgi:hypothetical protein
MAKPKKPFGGENKKYVGERGSRDQWVADALRIFGMPTSPSNEKENEEPPADNKPDKTTKKVEKNDKIRKIKWD